MTKRKKTILVIANLDTRGKEFLRVKEMIEKRGHGVIILDFSMEQEPSVRGDIPCEQVAQAGGMEIEDVRSWYRKEREKATDTMIRGAQKIVKGLVEQGKFDAILGVGGGTASLVANTLGQKTSRCTIPLWM